jgi:hypothetical protein
MLRQSGIRNAAPRSARDCAEAGSRAGALRPAEVPGSSTSQDRGRAGRLPAARPIRRPGLAAASGPSGTVAAAAAKSALLQYDPQAFYAQQAQYEADVAQRQELQRRAEEHAQQAKAREAWPSKPITRNSTASSSRTFRNTPIPRPAPSSRPSCQPSPGNWGIRPELISQARADDILAMRKVAELKAKADKYDALNAKKMEKVRAAKGLPRVATPGVPQGNEQLRANRATAAWEYRQDRQITKCARRSGCHMDGNTGWL